MNSGARLMTLLLPGDRMTGAMALMASDSSVQSYHFLSGIVFSQKMNNFPFTKTQWLRQVAGK